MASYRPIAREPGNKVTDVVLLLAGRGGREFVRLAEPFVKVSRMFRGLVRLELGVRYSRGADVQNESRVGLRLQPVLVRADGAHVHRGSNEMMYACDGPKYAAGFGSI